MKVIYIFSAVLIYIVFINSGCCELEQGEPVVGVYFDTCYVDQVNAEGIKQPIPVHCESNSAQYDKYEAFSRLTLPMNDSSVTFYLEKDGQTIDTLKFNYTLDYFVQDNCGYVSLIKSLKVDPKNSSYYEEDYYRLQHHRSDRALRLYWHDGDTGPFSGSEWPE